LKLKLATRLRKEGVGYPRLKLRSEEVMVLLNLTEDAVLHMVPCDVLTVRVPR
jgi:hypothetical protein